MARRVLAAAVIAALGAAGCSRAGEQAARGRDAAPAEGRDAALAAATADAAVAVPADAAAPARRGSTLTPVVTIDDVRYLLIDPDGPAADPAWGDGPMTVVDRAYGGTGLIAYGHEVKMRAATRAPAAVARRIGGTVTGHDAGGASCPLTIESLHLLGNYPGPDGVPADDVLLLGRLAPGACQPVVVGERPPARVFPRVAPTAAQQRAAVAAFRALPSYRDLARRHHWGNAAPRVALFRDDAKRTLRAVVGMESSAPCEGGHGALRAMFELAAGARPVLLAEVEDQLGTRVLAMFDADGDGAVELVMGPVSVDDSASGTTSLGSIWDWGAGDATGVVDVGFEYYTGCD